MTRAPPGARAWRQPPPACLRSPSACCSRSARFPRSPPNRRTPPTTCATAGIPNSARSRRSWSAAARSASCGRADVEGQVYAQPLLGDGTVLVATENNKVYGLDPATGAQKWTTPLNLGTPWKAGRHRLRRPDAEHRRDRDAGDRPRDQHRLHDAQDLRVGHVSGPARWYMDAIDVATGAEEPGFPVELERHARRTRPAQTFNADDRAAAPRPAADGRRRLRGVRRPLRLQALAGLGLRRLDRRRRSRRAGSR